MDLLIPTAKRDMDMVHVTLVAKKCASNSAKSAPVILQTVSLIVRTAPVILRFSSFSMVPPAGFEPAIFTLKG